MNGLDLFCEIVLRQELNNLNKTLERKISPSKRLRCLKRKTELEEKIQIYRELSLASQVIDSLATA